MQILRAESLRSLNTLALDCRAQALVTVSSDDEIREAITWALAEGLPVLPLGGGSNVVLRDTLEYLVLRQKPREITPLQELADRVLLRVPAACNWHHLVCQTLERNLYGLENLALIPGEAGAAPIQNIGAYGVELERFVHAVHALDIENGRALTLTAQECRFGYRDSIFKGELRDRVVITDVDLALYMRPHVQLTYPALQEEMAKRGIHEPQPRDVFDAVVSVRRRRLPDPSAEPNVGSFFKNPVLSADHARELLSAHPELPCYEQDDGSVKVPAAWLIEQCGWKGRREGGVGVHPQHALVLVNHASASGTELLSFADRIATSVRDRFEIELEMEPRVYGA